MLEKIFIKDYKNYDNYQVRIKYGTLASVFGIITNFLLAVAKMIIGAVFASVSVFSDGVNNFLDSFSSITSLIGFKVSGRPADEQHPYGHRRAEYVAGLIVAIIIIIVGVLLMESSIRKIIDKTPVNIDKFWLMVGVLIGSIFVKLWQVLFYRRIGKKIKSQTLKATSIDSMFDMFVTAMTIVSILIFKWTGYHVDGYFGVFVALIIVFSGIKLVKESMSPLLGEAADVTITNNIKQELVNYQPFLGYHELIVHTYGPGKIYATVHLEFDCREDILGIHERIDDLERMFEEKYGYQVVVHMDPIDFANPHLQSIYKQLEQIVLEIDQDITIHDVRIIKSHNYQTIVCDVYVPRECKLSLAKINQHIQAKFETPDENKYWLKLNIEYQY